MERVCKLNGKKLKRRGIVVRLMFVLVFSIQLNDALAKDENSQKRAADSEHTADEPREFILPSLSATHISWHEPSGRELLSSAIEISADGVRVREHGENSFQEMLQDFNGQRSWLIDHDRSMSHLIEIDETTAAAGSEPDEIPSFLGPIPCGVLKADYQGPGRWRGRRVSAFNCVDESDVVLAVEFIDDIYKLVVYRRTSDGYIDELRGLTDRTFNESHFFPPSEYRSVDKQEFFFGASDLLPYSSEAD